MKRERPSQLRIGAKLGSTVEPGYKHETIQVTLKREDLHIAMSSQPEEIAFRVHRTYFDSYQDVGFR